jgi:hypothetical protein
MNDETFLRYVSSHSRTERHAFHKDDVVRLGMLAGVLEIQAGDCGLGGFLGVDQHEADRLIELARMRMIKE